MGDVVWHAGDEAEHERMVQAEVERMATARLLPVIELAAGDELPYFVCSCPCTDGPCEHGPETWTVAKVETFYAGQQVTVTFTNGRQERGGRGMRLVTYERTGNPRESQ